MAAGRFVTVVEVGPRDGLQNEARPVPTDEKVAFVDALSATGLRVIEATAFVSPRAIPQLADSEELFRRVRKAEGVRYPVLVPNERGPMTGLDGLEWTSSTGAKVTFMPSDFSSTPIAWATSPARAAHSRA